jgi:hypothetical protein
VLLRDDWVAVIVKQPWPVRRAGLFSAHFLLKRRSGAGAYTDST